MNLTTETHFHGFMTSLIKCPYLPVLGGENRGFYQLMEELPQERLGLAVSSAASCEWMFEETRFVMQTLYFLSQLLCDVIGWVNECVFI